MPNKAAGQPTPIYVLTGFLGAGKTTLLNRLLKTPFLNETGFIINEFGAVGIDNALVETADESMVALMNGCLCCTIKGDLPDTAAALLERGRAAGKPLQSLVIETTGLADPAPIIQALLGAPFLQPLIRLSAVLTVLDAAQGEANLRRYAEARRQIAFADTVLLSKTDIAGGQAAARRLRQQIKAVNSTADIIIPPAAGDSQAEADFCRRLFTPQLSAASRPNAAMADAGDSYSAAEHSHSHDVNRHSDSIRSFVLTHSEPLPLFIAEQFTALLAARYGRKILRLKALLYTDENSAEVTLLQGVQGQFYPPQRLPPRRQQTAPNRTADSVRPACQIVIIAEDIEEQEARALFAACCDIPAVDSADRAALTHNPLAIPGIKF